MNFLAHAYLSGDSEKILLGNFIADFTKGKQAETYRGEVYLGMLLHREIDLFTDRHSQVAQSKKRLWRRHRHYSSVIVDIFYDHFLAKNWCDYSSTPLENFAQQVYAIMQRFDALLPTRAKQVLPHMIANNWLVNYGKMQGIDRAMRGMARRAAFRSEMATALNDLQNDYQMFEKDFRIFFPQLAAHCKIYRSQLANLHQHRSWYEQFGVHS